MLKFLLLSSLLITTLSVRLGPSPQSELQMSQTTDHLTTSFAGGSSGLTSFGIRAPLGSDAVMRFTGDGAGSVSLALLADSGAFVIKNDRKNLVEISQKGDEIVMGVSKLRAKSLQYFGDLLYMDIPQWKLIVNENYWQEPTGWSKNSISTCGGVNMLGGYAILAGTENSKQFRDIPPHKKLRITATFHFIDAWTGETAYMKVNIGRERSFEYVWTERYDSTQAANSINICGAHYGEGKFSTPIDITLPHVEDNVSILFGTTLDQDPQDESWGISNLSIYVM